MILSLSTPSAGLFVGVRASLPSRDSDLKFCFTRCTTLATDSIMT